MILITHCDSPDFWQTYLSDPASITMEGILIFNKHLVFLLAVIIIFLIFLSLSVLLIDKKQMVKVDMERP